ncbi:MAG: DUF969 domain-containing protein [Arenimonas sp.]|jgi:uncharacterized membrane protein
MNYWPLLGVLVVVVGFVLRLNPIAVVVTAGLASGLAAGKPLLDLLALIGESFVSQRALSLIFLTLPVIGVLEWAGLREQARRWIAGFKGLTLARLLISYLGVRQLLGMIGLTNIAGHAQTVRPLLAPMSEAAVEKSVGPMSSAQRQRVLAMTAGTDNVGLFFGEDVFIAFGGVLLIQGFLAENGVQLEPMQIALWALPTAIAAFVIHALRLWWFQRGLFAEGIAAEAAPTGASVGEGERAAD